MTNIFDRMTTAENRREAAAEPVPAASLAPNGNPAAASEETTRTPAEIRTAVQELLKHGYVEEANRQDLFRRILLHDAALNRLLEPLDLTLKVDTYRGVAFLAVIPNPTETAAEDEGWSHPLVRKQRLTLEQSLLVAILRQAFVIHEQESGVGQSPAKIAVDELLPHFRTYFGDSGSDSKDESRLLQLLDQLKPHGIVSEVDAKHEVTILPLIAHLANPESIAALLQVLKARTANQPTHEEREA